jgi:class 3 adenylate cyclase/tetratricopeptide (TPR) repeat protein
MLRAITSESGRAPTSTHRMLERMPCPSCGAVVPVGSRFCPSCGHALTGYVDERRVVTVLFGDLVGFTSLAETLDPEAVKVLVDRCFERLVRDIVEFGGRVDKILGDAVVALFGAPIAHEDDAQRAVRAALAMQNTMRAYAAEVGADIQMRIGVNTGEVLTGAMRAGGEYTAMGDVVNTANRLQTAARPGQVYVGPLTHQATADVIAYERIGPIQARGREETVEAHRAIDVLLLPGRRPRNRQVPLVGRDSEMALLRTAISLAFTQHRTMLVMILGDAGVGKTRLADEVAGWVERDLGGRMLESHCVPYGEANIWYPLGVAVRTLLDIGEGVPAAEARERALKSVGSLLSAESESPAVLQVTNSLLYLMGYYASSEVEPQRAREEAAGALIRVLEAITAERPVFFRLADLHWADDLVLEVIDEVIDGLGRSPFVLVATARHLLDPRWKPRTGRHNHLIVNLDPLDRYAAGELLDQLLVCDIDQDTRKMLLSRSGGNPFFLEELVALLERQELAAVPASDAASAWSHIELPETLRGLIAARLDRLTSDERALLDNAAVLGRSGSVLALEKVSEVSGKGATWRATLDVLVDKELFNLTGDRWSFRSDVLREVAYGTLTKSDRAYRHSEIAQWLERHLAEMDGDETVVDRVAYHYAQAALLSRELPFATNLPSDLVSRALTWLGEAGRRAMDAEVFVLAARLYSQALELARPQEDAGERLTFWLGRAEARFGLFELSGARADVEEAMRLADELDDREARTRARLIAGEILRREGDIGGALRALESALADSEELGDRRGQAEALRLLGMTRLYQRDFVDAERSTAAALEIFTDLGDRRGEAWALQNLAWISYLAGRVAEAEQRIDQSAAAFAEVGDTGGLGWANALLAYTRFHQGRLTEAENLAEAILPDARIRGDRFGEGMMLLLTALIRLWSGRTVPALDRAGEARSLFGKVGDSVGEVQALATYGRALLALGRFDAGYGALDEAWRLAERSPSPSTKGLASCVWVSAALHLGDVERAAHHAADLADSTDTVGDPGGADRDSALGLYHVQRGESAEAVALLEEAVRNVGPSPSPAVLATLALAQVTAGDTTGALASADRAHESNRSTYLDLAVGYVASGMAYALRGDVSEVIAAFASARQEVDGTGDVVAQAVIRLAESAGLAAVGSTSSRALRREADRRLSDLGLTASGWRTAFDRIAARPAAAPAL